MDKSEALLRDPGPRLPGVIPLAVNISVAMGVLLFSFSVYLTKSAAGGDFSTVTLSSALAGSVVMRGLLAVPTGRFVDRNGIRPIIMAGSVLGAAGLVGFGASTASWQVLASWWFLIGPAGAMLFFEPAFIAVNQWVDGPSRPNALGLLTMIGGASGVVFIPLSQWAVSVLGWRAAVSALACLLLIWGLSTALLAIPGPDSRGEEVSGSPVDRLRLTALTGDRTLVLFTASMMLSAFAIQGIIAHRLALFEEAGIAPGLAAVWASIGTAVSLPTRWYVPILSKRVEPARLHMLGIVVVAVGTALLYNADSVGRMIAHFTVFGLAFATLLPLRALAMSDRFAGPEYGSIMGAQWMLIMFAGAAGPGIVGMVKQMTGSYRAPVMAMAASMVLSYILIRRSTQQSPSTISSA